MPCVTHVAIGIYPASADEVKMKASLEGSHQASDKVKYSLATTDSHRQH
jgi:hypothetical protein